VTVIIINDCLFNIFTTAGVQKVTKIERQCFFYTVRPYGCSIRTSHCELPVETARAF